MRAVIALKLTDNIPQIKDADYIGADKGALVLAQNGIHMKLAIGDFDSVQEDDLQIISEYADEVIRLNPIKDDSDSEAALHEAIARGYDEILFIGAFGGRVDHSLVNLRLAYRYPDHVKFMDGRNLVYALSEGTYEITKGDYSYISFFTDEEAVISLEGFHYPLQHRRITHQDLYTLSNEISADTATLKVEEGKVLIIQCKD